MEKINEMIELIRNDLEISYKELNLDVFNKFMDIIENYDLGNMKLNDLFINEDMFKNTKTLINNPRFLLNGENRIKNIEEILIRLRRDFGEILYKLFKNVLLNETNYKYSQEQINCILSKVPKSLLEYKYYHDFGYLTLGVFSIELSLENNKIMNIYLSKKFDRKMEMRRGSDEYNITLDVCDVEHMKDVVKDFFDKYRERVKVVLDNPINNKLIKIKQNTDLMIKNGISSLMTLLLTESCKIRKKYKNSLFEINYTNTKYRNEINEKIKEIHSTFESYIPSFLENYDLISYNDGSHKIMNNMVTEEITLFLFNKKSLWDDIEVEIRSLINTPEIFRVSVSFIFEKTDKININGFIKIGKTKSLIKKINQIKYFWMSTK